LRTSENHRNFHVLNSHRQHAAGLFQTTQYGTIGFLAIADLVCLKMLRSSVDVQLRYESAFQTARALTLKPSSTLPIISGILRAEQFVKIVRRA